MITNALVGAHLWLANFFGGEYIVFQSTDEKKAGWGGAGEKNRGFVGDPEALLSRAYFMYTKLPPQLQTPVRISKEPPLLIFDHPDIQSTIKGISSNPFSFNQLTATAIFADEISKQSDAELAYQSALPILGDTGRYTAVGSAEGKNILYRLLYDLEGG